MNGKSTYFAILALCLASSGHAQSITSFSPTTATRSGLVRIIGSGFGTQGSVAISERKSRIARWDDNVIEFYVPESTPVGFHKVYISFQNGQWFSEALEVTNRPTSNGRVRWRFQAADSFIFAKPAVGPDGTIYAAGTYGHIYAITPDGGLKWMIRPSGGIHGTIAVGPDSSIYIGGNGGVQAFDRYGNRKWTVPLNSTIMAGPNIGPDGNIYVVDNLRWSASPSGAVVISPAGQVLWSGGRYYNRGANDLAKEIVFDNGRGYFFSEGDQGAIGGLATVNLGGGIGWAHPQGVGFTSGAWPTGGTTACLTSTIERLSGNGSRIWALNYSLLGFGQPKGHVMVAPNGNSYLFMTSTQLHGISAAGVKLFSTTVGGVLSEAGMRPDGGAILVGNAPNFGQPAHVRAYGSNGALLWQSENLPIEQGMVQSPYSKIAFTPDSSTAYFGTAGPNLANGVSYCYVYALNAK
jgi:hypothetical protein